MYGIINGDRVSKKEDFRERMIEMTVKSKRVRLMGVLLAVIICMAFMPVMMPAGKALATDEVFTHKLKIDGTDKAVDINQGAAVAYVDDLQMNKITIVDDKGVSREFKKQLGDYYDKDWKRMCDYGYNLYRWPIWEKGVVASDMEQYEGETISFQLVLYKCDDQARPLDEKGEIPRDEEGNIDYSKAVYLGITDPIKINIVSDSIIVVKKGVSYCVYFPYDENNAAVFVDESKIDLSKIKGKVTIAKSMIIKGKKYKVDEIGGGGFAGCKNLKEIALPEGLKKIGANAFRDTGLKSITIPDSVESIAANSIGFVNGKPVKGFVVYAKKNPAAEDYAYGKGFKYIDGKAATATKISVKSAKSKGKKVTLKWKKNKYVTGYQICKASKKNGKFKKAATVKKASKTKWTSKKLKAGKKTFFKIRAYTKISDKTFYGKWSKVKGVKVK